MNPLLPYFDQLYRLDSAAKAALSAVCSTIYLPKNELLQPIGQPCRTIYIVEKGIARIFYYKDGVDITEYFAAEQQLIVRAESLFKGIPSQKGIQVLEDTTLTAIPAAQLFQLFDEYPGIERLFRKIIETAYVDTVLRLESLQFNSAEERYKNLIESTPDIIKRVPLKYIASFLGITQVSLSRIRSKPLT
ncbi:MAG: Crp/Fnr family transcriptional regulator [Chitinophagales bacterium]|jgi:CRP-like cAMP-binding protein